MRLLVKIDQAGALKAGLDAPSSTAHVDVDPALLTQEERDYLASILRDGHDVSRDVTLIAPTVEALRAFIAQRLAEQVARAEAAAAERAKCDAACAETVERIRAEYAQRPVDDLLYSDHTPKTVYAVHDTWRHGYLVYSYEDARKTVAELTGRTAEVEAEIKRRHAADAAARKAAEAERKAEEAKVQAERAALIDRLPEPTRSRVRDGYAGELEVERLLRQFIRLDNGYPEQNPRDWDDSKRLTSLNDEEYQQLIAARESAPDGAKVEPVLIWDGYRGYRSATADDPEDVIDSDGEVWEKGRNAERAILVTLPPRGGITAKVLIRFE